MTNIPFSFTIEPIIRRTTHLPPHASHRSFGQPLILATSPYHGLSLSSQYINDAIPMAAGTLAFTAMLSISTLLQFKLFRISTGTPPPIPTMIGFGSVAAAALASHVVSVKAFQFVQQGYQLSISDFMPPSLDLNLDKQNVAHALRVCLVGLLAYKGLGGRFWSVAPSSITNLGSFARTTLSLPATEKYASKTQRKAIERLGLSIGCHTCGSRKIISRGMNGNGIKFIADHMPPLSVMKQMNDRWFRRILGITVKQRFYPQCFSCSSTQGGILSSATRSLMNYSETSAILRRGKLPNLSNAGGGKNAFNHGLTFRKEHFAGGLVAAATVYDASERDVLGGWHNDGGNRKRFLQWQMRLTDGINHVKSRVTFN